MKKYLQYIPRNMHTVFALLCFVVVIHWLFFPYPSGLLHWHRGNLTIAPVPAKQPWWIWINTSCEFIMNDYVTTTKQSITKPCAYLLGYTVNGNYRSCWWRGDAVKVLPEFSWNILASEPDGLSWTPQPSELQLWGIYMDCCLTGICVDRIWQTITSVSWYKQCKLSWCLDDVWMPGARTAQFQYLNWQIEFSISHG